MVWCGVYRGKGWDAGDGAVGAAARAFRQRSCGVPESRAKTRKNNRSRCEARRDRHRTRELASAALHSIAVPGMKARSTATAQRSLIGNASSASSKGVVVVRAA